jgi:hypothetical protein
MIYIANPRGRKKPKRKARKTKRKKTTRGSAGRRVKSATVKKSRHGGKSMAKRRKRRKRRVARKRKNPRRRVRRRATRRKTPRRKARRKARRRNPVRRRRRKARRKPVRRRRRRRVSRRRKNPRRRRKVYRRKARRKSPRRGRRRVYRRNPKLLPTKAYFKTVLGDAAGITAGYLANAGLAALIQGSSKSRGLLGTQIDKIANPHLKFAVWQTLNVVTAFATGWGICKLGGAKYKRLGENMTIGGLVRVLRHTLGYVSQVANFSFGVELLSGGPSGMGGFMQQGNVDALESAKMAGYLVEGGQMGSYDRDYAYDYAM